MWIFIFIFNFFMWSTLTIFFLLSNIHVSCSNINSQLNSCLCVCVCVYILVLNLDIITVINVTYKLCGLVGLLLDCLFSDAFWLNYRRYVKVATNPALLPVRDARWRAVELSFQKNHLTGKKSTVWDRPTQHAKESSLRKGQVKFRINNVFNFIANLSTLLI